MQVFFDQRFHEVYTGDPAAEKGRLAPAVRRLEADGHSLVGFEPASDDDVLRIHTAAHLEGVRRDERVYRMALLAAGGTLAAARACLDGRPTFALVRPPGHHASPDHCWGFCFFNNVAVALAALLAEGAIDRALVLDIDLHHGDGSENAFDAMGGRVIWVHPEAHTERDWLERCKRDLDRAGPVDLVAISAGFDRHRQDWGGQLTTPAYRQVGEWVQQAAAATARGRRFGVLEGGYNPDGLADAVAALLDGLA